VEITIFDEIGQYYGFSKRYLKYELDAAQGADINLLISSPGGDVTEGMAIADMLEMYSGNVETLGIGVVASIASVILMSGDKVKMTPNSFLMIHRPWGGAIGTADEMRSSADTLDKMDTMLVDYYVSKMQKRNKAEGNASLRIQRMMDAETWLTAQQALDLGFIDEIVQGGQLENQINIIPMQNRLSQYRHTPAALLTTTQNDNMSFFKSIQKMLGVDVEETPAQNKTVDPKNDGSIALEAAKVVLEAAGFTITEAIGIEDPAEMTEDPATEPVTAGDVTDGMALLAQEVAALKAQLKQTVGAPSGGGKSDAKPATGQPTASQKAFNSKLQPLVELLKQN